MFLIPDSRHGEEGFVISIHRLKRWSLAFAVLIFVPHFEGHSANRNLKPQAKAGSYYHYMLGTIASLESDPRRALEHFQYASHLDPQSTFLLFCQAQELTNLGQVNEAKNLFKMIGKGQDDNPDFHLLKARLASVKPNLEEAIPAMDRAIKIYEKRKNFGKRRETILTKAALLADFKKYPESIKALKAYLKSEPADEIAHYFLGKIHSLFQNHREAKAAYESALKLRPGFTAAAKAYGLQLELEGSVGEAKKIYNRALQSRGDDRELLQKLINLALIEEKYEEALAYLNQYLLVDPDDLQSQLRAALIEFKLNRYDSARTRFDKVLTREDAPKDRVHFYLGSLHKELSQHKDALQNFQKVSPSSEYFSESRIQLAIILKQEMKDAEAALRSLSEGVALQSNSVDLQIALANEHISQNQLAEGVRVLTKAAEIFQDNERIQFMLGTLLDKTGDFEGAIRRMRIVLEINPNNAHALNHIGYSFVERSMHLDEAEVLLKRAVQLIPDNGFVVDSLGWLYFKKGEWKKARDLLERANKLSPNEPVIMEHLANAYERAGNLEQALVIYHQIVRMSAKTDDESAEEHDAEFREINERVRAKIALINHEKTD